MKSVNTEFLYAYISRNAYKLHSPYKKLHFTYLLLNEDGILGMPKNQIKSIQSNQIKLIKKNIFFFKMSKNGIYRAEPHLDIRYDTYDI